MQATMLRADADDARSILEICNKDALDLLHRNLTPHGILAATPCERAHARRYTRVFGRDAGICAFAMLLGGDARLRAGAKASLIALADQQADNGQIPKFVDPERRDSDFWYLGCIDATLWWLIAVDLFAREAPAEGLHRELAPRVERALAWLRCQEHPRLHLLQQNEASDWADIMPRSGFVLYTNALWYHVKRRYRLPAAAETHRHFNQLFYPFSDDLPALQRLQLLTDYVRDRGRDDDLYLSFVNFSYWGDEGDVFGNLLAVLFGLADDARAARILDALARAQVDGVHPVRATCRVIRPGEPLWRAYMARHEQNFEHQYHNGGIWPFLGGFWVLALAAHGRHAQARAALDRLAAVNRIDGWGFIEWLHGESGAPRGMRGQSWNAAMFLLAQYGLERAVFAE